MVEGGWAAAMNLEWDNLFPEETAAPPASVRFVADLPVRDASTSECPICMTDKRDQKWIELPCQHQFHQHCISLWLARTNSCPVCRHRLPTDDAQYEEHMKRKVGVVLLTNI